MGLVNFLEGTVESGGRVRVGSALAVPVELPEWAGPGTRVWLAVRPEDLSLSPVVPGGPQTGDFTGTVRERTYLGNLIDYWVDVGGFTLRVQTHHAALFASGTPVAVRLDSERTAVIRRD